MTRKASQHELVVGCSTSIYVAMYNEEGSEEEMWGRSNCSMIVYEPSPMMMAKK